MRPVRSADPRPSVVREPRPTRLEPIEKPRPIERVQKVSTITPETTNIPTLTRLIDGMKSSFLPREEDASVLRLVVLSAPNITDPLMLITRDDTTVLVGS